MWALDSVTDPNPAISDTGELRCLALNVYWEARSEPTEGKRAVAHLTLNRVEASAFPDSICDVVGDGANAGTNWCQFSWMCDGRGDTPSDEVAWTDAKRHAQAAITGRSSDPTDGALYFHLTSVNPKWASRLQRVGRIGEHLFYK